MKEQKMLCSTISSDSVYLYKSSETNVVVQLIILTFILHTSIWIVDADSELALIDLALFLFKRHCHRII